MPLSATAVRLLDAMGDAVGLLRRPLRADELVESARRRTGLHDFGGDDFGEPLAHFLEACTDETALSVIGRFATHWDVVRFLSNLLRLRRKSTAPKTPVPVSASPSRFSSQGCRAAARPSCTG